MQKQRPTILLVEDSLADQIIVKRALEDGQVNCNLLVVENGLQALNLLRGEIPFENKERYPRPDLLLLDINMPIMDGKETLQKIREDESLKHIPVIALTTSSHEKDVIDSYRLGVNAFMTKPVDEQAYIRAVIQLEQFWLELVTLPSCANM